MSQPTAGPPSGGGAPGYDVPEDNAGVEPEKYFAVGKRRRLIGYWVGAIAVIFVGVVLLVAQSEVSSAFDVRQELSLNFAPRGRRPPESPAAASAGCSQAVLGRLSRFEDTRPPFPQVQPELCAGHPGTSAAGAA